MARSPDLTCRLRLRVDRPDRLSRRAPLVQTRVRVTGSRAAHTAAARARVVLWGALVVLVLWAGWRLIALLSGR